MFPKRTPPTWSESTTNEGRFFSSLLTHSLLLLLLSPRLTINVERTNRRGGKRKQPAFGGRFRRSFESSLSSVRSFGSLCHEKQEGGKRRVEDLRPSVGRSSIRFVVCRASVSQRRTKHIQIERVKKAKGNSESKRRKEGRPKKLQRTSEWDELGCDLLDLTSLYSSITVYGARRCHPFDRPSEEKKNLVFLFRRLSTTKRRKEKRRFFRPH